MGKSSIGLVLSSWVLLVGVAQADVVRPPPSSCPPGHEPRTGHRGPYCRPPMPTNCPPDRPPKVYHDKAYCEPPAPDPCPPGSRWTSRSETDTYCVGDRGCSGRSCSGEGQTCRETSLCTRWRGSGGRRREAVVSHSCKSDADCSKGEECKTAERCVSGAETAPPPPASQPLASPPPPPSATTPAAAPSIEVVPDPNKPPPAPGTSGCAGCATAPGHSTPLPWAFLALAWLGLRRRGCLRAPARC